MAQQAPNCLIELGERAPAVRYLIRDQTLPQIEKLLAEAAEADARYGALAEPTPRTLATRAERRDRLTRARDWPPRPGPARRAASQQEAWDAAAAAGVGVLLSQHPVDRTLLHPLLDTCCERLTQAGIRPKLRPVPADSGYVSEDNNRRVPGLHAPGCAR